MKDLFSIIYYTSNREDENFEAKIRKKLLEVCGNIPIISVSHKPINFGKNICIGDQIPSNATLFRQLLLGCREAKTPFVINAEADFLYCPEYFTLVPPKKDKIYRYNNIRIVYKNHYGFFRKDYSEGAQIAGREYLISILKDYEKYSHINELPHFLHLNPYKHLSFEPYGDENRSCVTFKTGSSLHKYIDIGRQKSLPELPYWGSATDLRKEMFEA